MSESKYDDVSNQERAEAIEKATNRILLAYQIMPTTETLELIIDTVDAVHEGRHGFIDPRLLVHIQSELANFRSLLVVCRAFNIAFLSAGVAGGRMMEMVREMEKDEEERKRMDHALAAMFYHMGKSGDA